jgi:hypothetical protein
MTAFSAEWLASRAAADSAARSSRLAQLVAQMLSAVDPIRILDLASGTGANVRYLSEFFPARQEWLLVDHDRDLLDHARRLLSSSVSHAEVRQADLRIITDGGAADLFSGRALVTASALLDLVSGAWLSTLATRCGENGSAVLFALTYDGRMQCTPEEPEDGRIRDLVNQHQRSDKGFGPALGPDAVGQAQHCFTRAGYSVQRERSDWILAPEAAALQRPLIQGWADAAVEIAPDEAPSIHAWRARRLAHVDALRSRLVVGHEDLAGWL